MKKHLIISKGKLRNDKSILVIVAELYYKDGLNQKEIAVRLGLSRATIISYLKQCRDEGIVDIQIKGSNYPVSNLSQSIRKKYNLVDVYVSQSELNGVDLNSYSSVTRSAAIALNELIRDGDSIGVAWGRTVQSVAQEMPTNLNRVANLSVCQLVGSMSSKEFMTSEASTIRISERLNAKCYTLHAPAILSSKNLADAIKREDVVKEQLLRLKRLDKIIFSVGNMGTDTVVVTTGIANKKELLEFKARQARAVLCGHFIDKDGQHLSGDYSARIIGISPEEIKRVPVRMCVASGLDKKNAILAALKGGFVSHLVIDHTLAEDLISD
jgi:DNA-binding transcriptional regulator LsrR (DeoR family)